MVLGWAVALASCSALLYEVLLTRLLSISLWHHMAFLIISLALLGYGASGVFLSLFRRRLMGNVGLTLVVNWGLFGITAMASMVVFRWIPFNPLELLWDPGQMLSMGMIYLVLSVPFFFAANGLGMTFYSFSNRIHGLYFWDLAGAGLGAALAVGLLGLMPPHGCIRLAAFGGLMASLLVLFSGARRMPPSCLIPIGLCVAGVWLLPSKVLMPPLSPYKGLSRALLVPNAEIVEQRWSPMGWWTVVESPTIPFRHAPGMGLNCKGEVPEQRAVFLDGEAFAFVVNSPKLPDVLGYIDCLTSALPYHLLDRPDVLVLEAGRASGVLNALLHGGRGVDAVDVHSTPVGILCGMKGGFTTTLCDEDLVKWHVSDPRGFLMSNKRTYDLIDLDLTGSASASFSGAASFGQSYLSTVEAMGLYLSRLREGGMLAVTTWLQIPPRGSLRLAATAIEAIRGGRMGEPRAMLAMVRSWNTVTLLVKRGAFTRRQIDAIRAFCGSRGFDPVYFPGIDPKEVNRRNVLRRAFLYEGVRELLGVNGPAFIKAYPYRVGPVCDDRPFFGHFLKWSYLGRFMAMRARGGISLLDWSFPMLLLCLFQALLLSGLLIILPVGLAGLKAGAGGMGIRVLVYFMAIGLGFLMLEVTAVQRFGLFLGHPVHSFVVVVASFLVFAGVGSGLSRGWEAWTRGSLGMDAVTAAVMAMTAIGVLGWLLVGPAPSWAMRLSLPLKALVVGSLIAPMALFMGMAFPIGIGRLARRRPEAIPWAWGINGCASVVGPILAMLLAMHLGFRAVMILALGLYWAAALWGVRAEPP